MRVLQTDAAYSLPDIEEELHGEVIFFFLKSAELTHLSQPFVYLMTISGEGHFVDLFLTQRTEAALFQESANLVKTELMFKCIRINHAAKLRISERKTK